jgi:hypothetical protein
MLVLRNHLEHLRKRPANVRRAAIAQVPGLTAGEREEWRLALGVGLTVSSRPGFAPGAIRTRTMRVRGGGQRSRRSRRARKASRASPPDDDGEPEPPKRRLTHSRPGEIEPPGRSIDARGAPGLPASAQHRSRLALSDQTELLRSATGIARPMRGALARQDCVSPAPLIHWAEKRLASLRREYGDDRRSALDCLFSELGWTDEARANAERRWSRWHTQKLVSLAAVEDALTGTPVSLFEIYPDAAAQLEERTCDAA